MGKLDPPATQLELYGPELPQVSVPPPPREARSQKDGTPVILATGLGWLLGGPVGAVVMGGASYLINQSDLPEPVQRGMSAERYEQELDQAFDQAATQFLERFSEQGLLALDRYVESAHPVIYPVITASSIDSSERQSQLEHTQRLLDDLQRYLQRAENLPDQDTREV